MNMKKDLMSVTDPTHELLLMVLPFGTGYLTSEENPLVACHASLGLAMALQACNHAANPALKFNTAKLH